MDNAGAPIRYRTARELLKDHQTADKIKPELLGNPVVQLWLQNLKPDMPPQHWSMEHGSFDFNLENALLKVVQLGLHAGFPQIKDAVQYYLGKIQAPPGKPVRNRSNQAGHIFTCNLLACAGFTDGAALDFLLESTDELYGFARKGSYDIYCNAEERAALKGIPAVYRDRPIIKSSIADVYGYCYPLVYDIIGLHKLFELNNPEIDSKIDCIIEYISTNEFHNTVADGYGVLPPFERKYHTMGWDPKYPGWYDVTDYTENINPRKLLFFALYISKYPLARKTKWFGELLGYLDTYKTAECRHQFPPEWFKENQGYAVQGSHLSFGENRRKKNWREIESTFYTQLIRQYI